MRPIHYKVGDLEGINNVIVKKPVDCLIDNNLRKKIECALKCRKALYEARGKEFLPALMRRYYLGTLPGDSFGNPIDISIVDHRPIKRNWRL
jgi:hypothetical protein